MSKKNTRAVKGNIILSYKSLFNNTRFTFKIYIQLKLIDAVWIWTEPHSMRLKIKLTLQKEVVNGAILQQAAIINYTVRNQQCESCQASYATGTWHALGIIHITL